MGSCKSINNLTNQKQRQIIVFLGSNSSSSINKTLLHQITSDSLFSKKPYKITVPKLSQVPFFNYDLIKQKKFSPTVKQLLNSASRATAFIFITPEYNGAVSSTILNAYEWITQVPKAFGQISDAMYRKPIAIMSCSYISQNQINDIKLMTKVSFVKLFKETFYVDLKQDPINSEAKVLSPKLRNTLQEWLQRLARFI